AGTPQPPGEQSDEEVVDRWVLPAQSSEIRVVDGVGLAGLQGRHGRRADRVGLDDGQLPERLPRTVHRQRRRVAEPRADSRGEMPLADEVKRVGWIPLVEHDFPALEAPTPGHRDQAAQLAFGEPPEDLPVEHGAPSVTDVTPGPSPAYGTQQGPAACVRLVGMTVRTSRGHGR